MAYRPSYQEEAANALITRDLVVDGSILATNGIAIIDLGGVPRVRYVRPTGNNANDGLTPATAWETFIFAVTKLLPLTRNGVQVLDITGISERLVDGFTLPQIMSDTPFLNWAPGFLGVAGAVTIHSDLIPFLTIDPVDISSITSNATNFQSTINTTLSLVPGTLKGKFVSQFGTPLGVVKDNSDADIQVTVQGLSPFDPIILSDSGANLSTFGIASLPTFTIQNSLCSILLEGIVFAAPQSFSPALRIGGSVITGGTGGVGVSACAIAGLMVTDTPEVFYMFESYVLPSDGGSTICNLPAPSIIQGSFFEGLNFNYSDDFVGGGGVSFSGCAFYTCEPLFGGSAEPLIGRAECTSCEVLNPTGPAFQMQGQGVFIITYTTIDGCSSPCIVASGQMNVYLKEIPAGSGNADFGVIASQGVDIEASVAVLLTGVAGDTSIGTLGATAWTDITAAPNNRISDFSANGDGSSICRTP